MNSYSSSCSPRLTDADLEAAVAKLPRRERIIVGFPLVDPDVILRCESEGLVLMGRAAYDGFMASVATVDEGVPRYPQLLMPRCFEFWDGLNPDHRKLLERLILGVLATKQATSAEKSL